MGLRGKLFALTYDRQMAKAEKAQLGALRQSLLAAADGDVLEIGGGTGANLPFYRPEAGSLTITEPEPATGHDPAGARRGPPVRGQHL
jgi:hypothetical protein